MQIAMFGQQSLPVIAAKKRLKSFGSRTISGLIENDAGLIDRDGALVPVPEKRSEDPEGAEQALVDLAVSLEERPDVVSHLVPAHSGGSSDLSVLWDWLP